MSKSLMINLLLALVWTFISGELTIFNFALGFALGYLILLIAQPLLPVTHYAQRLWYVLDLLVVFLLDLALSSFKVAWDIITPDDDLEPGVIAVPLDVKTELEITVLANLISLTPGTLTLDHSSDRKYLFVHMMHIDNRDVDAERLRIKEHFERRVSRAFGPEVDETTSSDT